MALLLSNAWLYWNGTITPTYPLSMFIWVKPTALTLTQNAYLIGTGQWGSNEDLQIVANGAQAGDPLSLESKQDDTAAVYTDSAAAMVEGVWQPALAVFESTTSRRIYFAGGAVQSSTASNNATPSTHTTVHIGARSTNAAYPFTGEIGEVAMWSSALGQTDFDALAAGAVPSSIQAGTLIEYWPLQSNTTTFTGVNGRVLTKVLTSGTITEASTHPIALPDSVAPTLTSPTGAATGSTTAGGTVTTSEANGTLYRLASTNSTELAATVKAAALTQAVSGTSLTASFTGLTASTTYYAHYVHRDAAGNDSARVSSASFTTSAAAATATTLAGPSGGAVSAASGNFTVGANGTITGTVTVTPSDGGGGGAFSPTSVAISSGTPTATFVYTPGSIGAKTISISDTGSLTDAASLTYTATLTSGTLTSSPLKNNTGTLLTSAACEAYVSNPTTGALVIKKTGLTTNGTTGVASFSDGAVVASTSYRVVWKTTGDGAEGLETLTAT